MQNGSLPLTHSVTRPRFDIVLTPPAGPLRGRVTPPGSKSITNRALLLAALAKGTSRLTGALKSDDTRYMAQALRAMGVTVDEPDPTSFVVTGTGRLIAPGGRHPEGGLPEGGLPAGGSPDAGGDSSAPLFLGNAGTATRFLTAAVASVDGTVIVDGDVHMRKRPIEPLLAALRALGIDASAPTGCPPVTIRGTGRIPAGRVSIDGGLSSQYVSALLMMAPLGAGPIEVALAGKDLDARGYVDLTVAAMAAFGAEVTAFTDRTGTPVWKMAPTGYRAADLVIEPDASAATYLWAAEGLTGGKIDLGVPAAVFTQPDARAHDVIRQFPHLPPVIDGSQMQDAVPTLAVLAAFNRTAVRFTGIANLRVKECDRVAALATELSRIRAGLGRQDGDDLIVSSDPGLAGQYLPTRIETYADHRIAMSFALAGLKIGGITILDAGCVAKTYPGYWDDLATLGVELVRRDE